MPTVYVNNGLRIYLNPRENGHNRRHVHVAYKDKAASFTFDGEQMNGDKLPRKVVKEIQLYLAHHQDYLNALWVERF